MKKMKIQTITLMGLLLAAGLLIPFVTSHAFGISGTILLPMHLPVFLMGMLLGPVYGAIGGIITPILSSILTGMPPVFPMLPIMMVLDEDKKLLENAIVVDKIIGKAAALLLVLGGADGVYGKVMSKAGKEYLDSKGIQTNYGRCIEVINKRDGNGMCPLEKSVADIDNPEEAYQKLKETIAKLMRAAG